MYQNLKGINNLDELLAKIGMDYLIFERTLFAYAKYFSEDYDGGIWKSNILLNEDNEKMDGFYLTLDDKQYKLRNTPNELNFDSLQSKTFTLVVFAMTTNHAGLNFYKNGKEKSAEILFELFYFVRNNIEKILDDEEERIKFFKFID